MSSSFPKPLPMPETPARRNLRPDPRLLAILIAATLTAPLLHGCAPIVVGGVAVGAATLHDRRPYYVVIDDQDIEFSAMAVIDKDPGLKVNSRIAVTSYNRHVLLTGQAETLTLAERAADLVSRLKKVEVVINEITVGPPISLGRESEDVVLTSRVKLALADVSLPDFDPTRVKVVTEDAVVYLMGLVTSQEADAATEKVRFVPGVKRVVRLFEITAPNT